MQHHAGRGAISRVGDVTHHGVPQSEAVQPQLVAPSTLWAEEKLGHDLPTQRAAIHNVAVGHGGQRLGASRLTFQGHAEPSPIQGVLTHAALDTHVVPLGVTLHQREVSLRHCPSFEELPRHARRLLVQCNAKHA